MRKLLHEILTEDLCLYEIYCLFYKQSLKEVYIERVSEVTPGQRVGVLCHSCALSRRAGGAGQQWGGYTLCELSRHGVCLYYASCVDVKHNKIINDGHSRFS